MFWVLLFYLFLVQLY